MDSYIRCPQCGHHNDKDDKKLTRCIECHKDLLRCEYCRFLRNNKCSNPLAQMYYTEDGEAAKECPQFESNLIEKKADFHSPLAATIWVPASLAIVIGMIVWTIFITNPSAWASDTNSLRMEVSSPTEVTWNKSFPVTITLWNSGWQGSPPIFIEFDETVLMGERPTPEPIRLTHERGRMVLEYATLPAAERMVVTLPVTPRQLGLAPFRARLFSPRINLRESIATDIKVIRQVTRTPNGGIEP